MGTDTGQDAAHRSVSAVLGNMADGGWSARLQAARIDVLVLTAAEAQRSRLRKRTTQGSDVAVALDRSAQLIDGDVLAWDEASQTALVVRVDLPDVMVVDLSALLGGPPETLLARSVEVGHALGNQHWPAVVKGSQVLVPVTAAAEVMAKVMNSHHIEAVSCSFAPGSEVQRQLTPPEARLLFTGLAGHSHVPAGAAAEEAG
jgi:urease accessory protein